MKRNVKQATLSLNSSVVYWAKRIKGLKYQSLANAMAIGRTLVKAKSALAHGQWLPMLNAADMDKRTAQMYMKIGRDPRFANASLDSHLPPSVHTLYAISRMPDSLYRQFVERGEIHFGTSRRDVVAILRRAQREADERRVRLLTPVPGRFRTLIIDPPWESGGGRDCPYATISKPQLLDLPVPQWLEDDGHLYVWATGAELNNARRLFEHWGVSLKEHLVWNKIDMAGRPRMGMGQYFRHTCEFVLFGVRGRVRPRLAGTKLGTSFSAPVPRGHSSKPEQFYDIVRQVSYGPFGEAFQRVPRAGVVGLYVEGDTTELAA
jgi:N6-adenosine-specific RNA methylase IME4